MISREEEIRIERRRAVETSRRKTLALVVCADLFLVLFLLFFLIPSLRGIDTPWCMPYSYTPGDSESLSFAYLGIGIVHYQGHYVWFWSSTSFAPDSPFQCHDETSTSSST
jgi:hypothetical protein